MAQSGYTPILIYASGTASNVPLAANLTSSASGAELALNYADGKLYFKNSSGVVTLLAGSGGGGPAAGSNTQIQFNNSGVFGASANLTWSGTVLSTTGLTATGAITLNTTTNNQSYTTTGAGTITISSGTAGSINNMNIGATTAGTGTFTNLTYTGTLTGSTGVIAIGTNQIYKDSSGNVGIGTSSPGVKLDVSGVIRSTGTSAILSFSKRSTGTGDAWGMYSQSGEYNIYDYTAGVSRLVIDTSGTVLVGITSATANSLIQLSNGIASTAGASNKISLYYASAASAFGLGIASGQFTYNSGDGAHVFYTGGNTSPVERMRIDSSGNVVIGNSVDNNTRVLNFNSVSGGSSSIQSITVGATNQALTFSTTFATLGERMRITGDGNVGIGTSSPSAKLDITGSGGVISKFQNFAGSSGIDSYVAEGTSAAPTALISGRQIMNYRSYGYDGASYIFVGGIDMQAESAFSVGTNPTYLRFRTSPSSGTGTERMRIDSSGNVGIGTSSPAALLHVRKDQTAATYIMADNAGTVNAATSSGFACAEAGAVTGFLRGVRDGSGVIQLYNVNPNPLTFGTNNTERMRIDSSGNLLVGTTSALASERLNVTQPNNTTGIYVYATNASFSGTGIFINTARAANAAFDLIGAYANSVGQFRVSGAGVIYAQNIVVQSISDQRLKENILESTDGLNIINALRPVRYDWKKGFGNDQKNQLGFIAQEIETVFPEAVGEWQVNKDDETIYKTVGPSALIPVLVKAIQEQQALITSLTARIEALEAR